MSILQSISQNKYDMSIEIDEIALHLMLIYIFGKLFKIW